MSANTRCFSSDNNSVLQITFASIIWQSYIWRQLNVIMHGTYTYNLSDCSAILAGITNFFFCSQFLRNFLYISLLQTAAHHFLVVFHVHDERAVTRVLVGWWINEVSPRRTPPYLCVCPRCVKVVWQGAFCVTMAPCSATTPPLTVSLTMLIIRNTLHRLARFWCRELREGWNNSENTYTTTF